MTTFSIEKRMDELDVAKMREDERVPVAIDEILVALALDERSRPIWPECPIDQVYILIDAWKATLLAAKDHKEKNLSPEMYRAGLAILAAGVLRAMLHIEVEK